MALWRYLSVVAYNGVFPMVLLRLTPVLSHSVLPVSRADECMTV